MSGPYYDWIDYHARNNPDGVAIVDLASERRFTYLALRARIAALAQFLSAKLGVSSGDRVCVLAKSCVEVFEVQFACAKLGAIFLPVNWRLTPNELKYILRDAAPVVILVERDFAAIAMELAGGTGGPALVEFGAGRPDTTYETGIASYLGTKPPSVSVDLESIWAILYTSGTTGNPKGAMLSYRMMLTNVLNLTPARLTSATVFLCALPTFHTGGLNYFANPVLHAGGTILVMREFDPAAALALLESETAGVTHFFGTPTHYLFISQQVAFGRAEFPTLSVAGLGGAPATDALVRTWLDKGVPLQPAYGMTEIGPAILITSLDQKVAKIGSSGQPVMHCDFKIAGTAGQELPVGEIGEICVRGPVLMSGYWQNPEATERSFRDGWFLTGDAAYRDEDGSIFIVDRLKDMFISGGENVYPVEVENVICGLPGIAAAAVIGVSDDTWGEVGRAFIVRKVGQTVATDDVLAHCRARLAKFKIPKTIAFVEELPRTASGKVQKGELRTRTSPPNEDER